MVGEHLRVWSDGGVDQDGKVEIRGGGVGKQVGIMGAVYAWMVGAVEGIDTVTTGGEVRVGWVDSVSRDGRVSSFRAEAVGLLQAMKGIDGRWGGGVWHWLDNESVVGVYGKLEEIREGSWWKLEDRDVWEEVLVMKRRWGERYVVKWVRGHPERRKPEVEWSMIEWGNHWVDKAADEAYKRVWNWGGSRSSVGGGVAVRAGEGWIHGKLRIGLTEWVREKMGDKYLHESCREWDGGGGEGQSARGHDDRD